MVHIDNATALLPQPLLITSIEHYGMHIMLLQSFHSHSVNMLATNHNYYNSSTNVVMPENYIMFCRNKERREAAILLEQAVTSQRAMQHAAWGAKKDISAKLKVLKDETVSPRSIHPTGRRKASPGKTHGELVMWANVASFHCSDIVRYTGMRSACIIIPVHIYNVMYIEFRAIIVHACIFIAGASGRKRHQQNFSRPPSYRSTPKPPIIKLRPHQARKTSERKNFVSTPG